PCAFHSSMGVPPMPSMFKGNLILLLTTSLAWAQNLPPHPRLILPDSDLPQVKKRIEQFDWAKSAFKFLASRVFGLDDRRATPAERFNNGRDFVPTNKWVLFGHHFAAIAGAGPLVGPVLAAQFGFLPGTLWLVIGVVVGGAVQDFVILFCSLRRDGKSLGQMAKEEVYPAAGATAMLALLFI